ncbi:hypothetical protein P9314_21215 [Paenibacillus validus]|uniref:Uncharacterized protein n=1 Tax=Paenibacillus validus TaxID=44253 RepID=A0A7X2ZG74_9BACL|nr:MULTISPECIES: hypothetical protein [Paenibacillus]MED4603147.1 hypothetical protein [Paenibacillus validus]MED4609307.1 hypothetical protein [Paenibacillus validus]MUG73730.1 hypothetical protein [Paenibacillus validus]
MLPFQVRMAELWTLHQSRELTTDESNELTMCLQANANYARKLSELHNYIYAASLVGDKTWMDELNTRAALIDQEFQLHLAAWKNSRFGKGQPGQP